MVAASAKTRSPAKRGAGKPSPVITKAKTPSSPLASPTPSQRSRGRTSIKPEERSAAVAKSPTSRSRGEALSPRGTPRRGAAVKACLNMEAAAADEAAFEEKSSRRSKKDDEDYDVDMDADDAFDEPSFGMKKPPRPRSKPGTPRYVTAPFSRVSPRISSGFASGTSPNARQLAHEPRSTCLLAPFGRAIARSERDLKGPSCRTFRLPATFRRPSRFFRSIFSRCARRRAARIESRPSLTTFPSPFRSRHTQETCGVHAHAGLRRG